jgi:hypothetical protein
MHEAVSIEKYLVFNEDRNNVGKQADLHQLGRMSNSPIPRTLFLWSPVPAFSEDSDARHLQGRKRVAGVHRDCRAAVASTPQPFVLCWRTLLL